MKNKNFSCFEYEANERERLKNLYSETFPETDAKMSGKDLQENTSERIVKVIQSYTPIINKVIWDK